MRDIVLLFRREKTTIGRPSGIELRIAWEINQTFALTVGGDLNDGRGNIVMNIGFTSQEKVNQGARDFSLVSLSNMLTPEGSFTQRSGTLIGNFSTVGGGTLENSGNTYPATYDPLGRSSFVGFNPQL